MASCGEERRGVFEGRERDEGEVIARESGEEGVAREREGYPREEYHTRDESVVDHCEMCTLVDRRCFYIHHPSRSSHWEPPWARWRCRLGLPYAWEQAVDRDGRVYYLDHIEERSTYADPRLPRVERGIRRVQLRRDERVGYGFVAAGQHPVVVQFVSPGGPSDSLLFANDGILSVDGVNVEKEDKDVVVGLVRAAVDTITLDVEQLSFPQSSTRRACRVRFTEKISVSSPDSPLNHLPISIPNVLRVFLENGQTRSFKYDKKTTVEDVTCMLCEKLHIRLTSHFTLALEYTIGSRSSRMTLIDKDTTIHELASSRYSSSTRCVLRFAFVPLEPHSLYMEDPRSFEYFYSQCVNDVVCGRFAFEMRYEACIRLAALHMQQVSMDCRLLKDGRVSLSRMEKELGLATFLPTILVENVKRKEMRRHLRFYLKRDGEGEGGCTPRKCTHKTDEPSQSSVAVNSLDSSVVIRLKYMRILSHLPSFASRSFYVTFVESHVDMTMQIDARSGIVIRHCARSSTVSPQGAISIPFQLLSRLSIQQETETLSTLVIRLTNDAQQGLQFLVEASDLSELLVYLQGYYQIVIGGKLPCDRAKSRIDDGTSRHPPPYASVHTVFPAGWNYSCDASPGEKVVDLRDRPPSYETATTFTLTHSEEVVDRGLKMSEAHPSLPPSLPSSIPSSLPPSLPASSPPPEIEKPRMLLKATDSLMIKKNRELYERETRINIIKSQSNPHGILGLVTSDSSDTEDSSRSESMHVPPDRSLPPQSSFGLSSPDSFPSIPIPEESIKEDPSLNSLLLLFPDTVCTDELIDLTTPIGNQKMIGEGTPRPIRAPPPLPVHSSPLDHSSSSPMTTQDIVEFLHRSNSICEDDDISSSVLTRPTTFRRMSLKEFTGLDPTTRDFSLSKWKDSPPRSLLSSFSIRRRSSSLHNPSVPPSLPPPPAPLSPLTSPSNNQTADLLVLTARLEMLRLRLGGEEENEEGRKKEGIGMIKEKLMNDVMELSRVSKALVSDKTSGLGVSQSLSRSLIEVSSSLADHSLLYCSSIHNVFHSQLLSSNVDQVLSNLLSALSHTPSDPSLSDPSIPPSDPLHPPPPPSPTLINISTSLAASLSQLMHTVSSL